MSRAFLSTEGKKTITWHLPKSTGMVSERLGQKMCFNCLGNTTDAGRCLTSLCPPNSPGLPRQCQEALEALFGPSPDRWVCFQPTPGRSAKGE